jgi:hypothetical protein
MRRLLSCIHVELSDVATSGPRHGCRRLLIVAEGQTTSSFSSLLTSQVSPSRPSTFPSLLPALPAACLPGHGKTLAPLIFLRHYGVEYSIITTY